MPKVIRLSDGERYRFICPVCNCTHTISNKWSFNGDYEYPTFHPSILVKTGHYADNFDGKNCWCKFYAERPGEEPDFKCFRCHSFITDGRIQYLSDSSHELAGQIVDLPDWDEGEI